MVAAYANRCIAVAARVTGSAPGTSQFRQRYYRRHFTTGASRFDDCCCCCCRGCGKDDRAIEFDTALNTCGPATFSAGQRCECKQQQGEYPLVHRLRTLASVSGNPAIIRRMPLRPVTLRPCFSTGLPLYKYCDLQCRPSRNTHAIRDSTNKYQIDCSYILPRLWVITAPADAAPTLKIPTRSRR